MSEEAEKELRKYCDKPINVKSNWDDRYKTCTCQGFYQPYDCPVHGRK